MQKNDILNLEIVDVGCNGEGVAKMDNIVIFVPFALKGEIVKAHILKVNKSVAFAKLIEVLSPSKDRCTPPCKHFSKCGGCSMQHIKYDKQLEIKRQIVIDALKKYAGITCDVKPCTPSNKVYHYRNKMQYPVTPSGVGMYKTNSHSLVRIENCCLSMSLCQKAYEIVRNFIEQFNISSYDEQTKQGQLRNLLFREVEDKISICLVINAKELPHINNLIENLKKEFNENFSLHYNINTKHNNTILSNNTICIYGNDVIVGNSFDVEFEISPNSFMQINPYVQNAIYSHVLSLANASQIVFNAYSGAGLLTAMLAKKCTKVYGIEIVEQATINANKLMQQNNITNVLNITGKTEDEISKLMQMHEKDNTLLVLDPPRKGVEKQVVEAINKSPPRTIVYISCNPATLARDISLLNGYKILAITPYDMFPQTRHVECVAHLVYNND